MDIEIGAMVVEDHNDWPQLSLSPLHAKFYMETRAALLFSQPMFADILTRMMKNKDKSLAHFTDQIPIAATNDAVVFLNPMEFFKFSLKERIFIKCHEICHAMFNHCGMMSRFRKNGYILYADGLKLPFDNDMCQISTDCLINDMLVRGKAGEMPMKNGKPAGGIGLAGITYMDDIASAYRKFFEEQHGKGKKGAKNYSKSKEQGQPSPGAGKGGIPNGFDKHLEPGQGQGKSVGQAESERNPQAWDNAIIAAIANAKAQGKLPAALERGLTKLLAPKVEWRDQFTFTVASKVGMNFNSWNNLDNELMLRGIGSPGKTKYGCDTIVFVTDSSGSINQPTMDMFNSEGVGLMEQMRPKTLIYIQCDAKIHECVELDDPSDMMRRVKGGGGTDFRPVFEHIERNGIEPDALVYLTDLEGTFPREIPPYPVIWATITEHPVPFGDVVVIPGQLPD